MPRVQIVSISSVALNGQVAFTGVSCNEDQSDAFVLCSIGSGGGVRVTRARGYGGAGGPRLDGGKRVD